jgi:hypothetical protein
LSQVFRPHMVLTLYADEPAKEPQVLGNAVTVEVGPGTQVSDLTNQMSYASIWLLPTACAYSLGISLKLSAMESRISSSLDAWARTVSRRSQ